MHLTANLAVSLYFRSILTVPWMEMGGKVTVTCNKTGYNAAVDFHTKVNIKGSIDTTLGFCRL